MRLTRTLYNSASRAGYLDRQRHNVLNKMLRVSQARRLGADRIYCEQSYIVNKDQIHAPVKQKIWDQEKAQLEDLKYLDSRHRTRKSLLEPFWSLGGINLKSAAVSASGLQQRALHTTSVKCAIMVPLPALSPTMEKGTIVSWEKKEGDRLNDGDLLAEIETDKATMGFETPEEGYLAKILIPAGSKDVPLGKLLCIIVEDEADIAKYKDYVDEASSAPIDQGQASPPPPAASFTPPPQSSPTQSSAPVQQQSFSAPAQQINNTTGRVLASPFAKKLASQLGITLSGSGSGPNGRIVANDLESLAQQHTSGSGQQQLVSQGSSTGTFSDISLTSMRQTIAKRLVLSKQTVPHYYLTVNLNVDELIKLRKTVNDMLAEDGVKVSINDFITKAAALACRQVPEVNSAWHETFIRQYNNVDVCIAVSTDNGLITPIVFGAESKGIKQISLETKGLAEKARQGKLQPHEFQGGTFTISNLGMFNIAHFAAVINPPQAAILAIGSTQKLVVPSNSDGQDMKVINSLNVTLSCDHRVVDGAVGAKWLGWFRQYMEKPFTMML